MSLSNSPVGSRYGVEIRHSHRRFFCRDFSKEIVVSPDLSWVPFRASTERGWWGVRSLTIHCMHMENRGGFRSWTGTVDWSLITSFGSAFVFAKQDARLLHYKSTIDGKKGHPWVTTLHRLESVSQFHKTIAQIRTENPDAGLFRLNFHFDEAICAMETAQKVSV